MHEFASHRIFEEPGNFGFIWGAGPAIEALNALVSEIARTPIPVLISGESGTGKDTYARLLHRLAQDKQSKFCKINCGTIDSDGLQSHLRELNRDSDGQSSRHSVYLDSVQDLDLLSQRALLSYFAEEEDPSCAARPKTRFISSTTGNLEAEVERGRFRSELYFRLNGARLRLPPLRERKEDIPSLVEHFLNIHAVTSKSKSTFLSTKVVKTLLAYSWPGNIRELENLAVRMIAFGDAHIALDDLLIARIQHENGAEEESSASLKAASRSASRRVERELIAQALERTHWNRKKAAQELQISYKSLLYKIKRIEGLDRKQDV